jgi:hypothetical protein
MEKVGDGQVEQRVEQEKQRWIDSYLWVPLSELGRQDSNLQLPH